MTAQILTIVISLLTIAIGLWKYFDRKKVEKRKQAEQARKDLDEANQTNDPGKFLDAWGRL